MKKILILLIGAVLSIQATAFASIHYTKLSNIESTRSAFVYKDVQAVTTSTSKQTQDTDKALFSIFVSKDKFHTEKGYRENLNIAFTSHNQNRYYIFDEDCPPYLLLEGKDKKDEKLYFSKLKYDNPYWISFSLTKEEINKIEQAQNVKIVLPEASENPFYFDEDKEKISKKQYNKSIKTEDKTYIIPTEILNEWKNVFKQ